MIACTTAHHIATSSVALIEIEETGGETEEGEGEEEEGEEWR